MKKVLLMIVATLVVGSLATSSWAAAKDANKAASDGQWLAERIVKQLNITDPAKQSQINQLCQTRRSEMNNWRSENGQKIADLREQMRAARDANEQAKVKELQSQIKTLRESREKINENFFKQLGDVLTTEQVDKVRNLLKERDAGEKRINRLMSNLGLSPDQQAKVAGIVKEARKSAENAYELQDKEKVWNDALQKISNEVLTADQRAKLKELEKKEAQEATAGESQSKPAREKKKETKSK